MSRGPRYEVVNANVVPPLMRKQNRLLPAFYYGTFHQEYLKGHYVPFTSIDSSSPLGIVSVLYNAKVLNNVARGIKDFRHSAYYLPHYLFVAWVENNEKEPVSENICPLKDLEGEKGESRIVELFRYYLVCVQVVELGEKNVIPTFESFIAQFSHVYVPDGGDKGEDDLWVFEFEEIPETRRRLLGSSPVSRESLFGERESIYAYAAYAGARVLLNAANSRWDNIFCQVPRLLVDEYEYNSETYYQFRADFSLTAAYDRVLYKSGKLHITGAYNFISNTLPFGLVPLDTVQSARVGFRSEDIGSHVSHERPRYSHLFGHPNEGYMFRIALKQ